MLLSRTHLGREKQRNSNLCLSQIPRQNTHPSLFSISPLMIKRRKSHLDLSLSLSLALSLRAFLGLGLVVPRASSLFVSMASSLSVVATLTLKICINPVAHPLSRLIRPPETLATIADWECPNCLPLATASIHRYTPSSLQGYLMPPMIRYLHLGHRGWCFANWEGEGMVVACVGEQWCSACELHVYHSSPYHAWFQGVFLFFFYFFVISL